MTGDVEVVEAVPDVPDAVRGWRQWRLDVVGDRPRLVSPTYPARWEPGRAFDATCAAPHPPPADGCGCGIYAVRSVGTAARAALTSSADLVVGRVALWGEVVEGEAGWRAARAYPDLLIVDPLVDDATAESLHLDYGVPVRRSPVPLSFLRDQVPDAPPVRLQRVAGRGRQERVLDLFARQGSAADPDLPVEEFLRLTALLHHELREASRAYIPREVLRTSATLCLVPVLWAGIVAALVGSATRWPSVVQTLLALVAVAGLLGVLAALTAGLESFAALIRNRFAGSHRAVSAVLTGPVLAAWTLQTLVALGLFAGTVPPVLFPVLGTLPLGIALTAAVGWWRSFPTARSRHRPRPVPRLPAAPARSRRRG